MFAILTMIKTLFQLLPLVVDAIKTVEAAFPNAKQGAAKLDIVKGVIGHAYTVATGAESAFETIAPGIEVIAKSAVAIFNSTGTFTSAAAATVPAAASAPAAPAVAAGALAVDTTQYAGG